MSDEESILSFQEFRLIYESAEKVTDRRINNNRSNYAISLGVMIAIAIIVNWTISNNGYYLWAMAAVLALSSLGMLFCVGWINQIRDYKNLNTAKFKVMSEMAQKMRFDSDYKEVPVSYRPFEREWEILSEMQGALSMQSMGMTLSSTASENLLPRGLIFLFILCFVGAVVLMVNGGFL